MLCASVHGVWGEDSTVCSPVAEHGDISVPQIGYVPWICLSKVMLCSMASSALPYADSGREIAPLVVFPKIRLATVGQNRLSL